MRVRVHRVDELDSIEKYMTGSELVRKVAKSLPTDPGFIPLSKIRTSVTFELDSTRNHTKSDIYISKSEESRLKDLIEGAKNITTSDGTAVAELDHVKDDPWGSGVQFEKGNDIDCVYDSGEDEYVFPHPTVVSRVQKSLKAVHKYLKDNGHTVIIHPYFYTDRNNDKQRSYSFPPIGEARLRTIQFKLQVTIDGSKSDLLSINKFSDLKDCFTYFRDNGVISDQELKAVNASLSKLNNKKGTDSGPTGSKGSQARGLDKEDGVLGISLSPNADNYHKILLLSPERNRNPRIRAEVVLRTVAVSRHQFIIKDNELLMK